MAKSKKFEIGDEIVHENGTIARVLRFKTNPMDYHSVRVLGRRRPNGEIIMMGDPYEGTIHGFGRWSLLAKPTPEEEALRVRGNTYNRRNNRERFGRYSPER